MELQTNKNEANGQVPDEIKLKPIIEAEPEIDSKKLSVIVERLPGVHYTGL